MYLYEQAQYAAERVVEQVLYPLYRQFATVQCAEAVEQVRQALQQNRGVIAVKYD